MHIEEIITIDSLGLLAGALTTIAFVPQVIKTWNSKSADDVSTVMFICFISGVLLWCIYGWEIHAKPIVIANIITFLLASCILTLKIVFEKRTQDT